MGVGMGLATAPVPGPVATIVPAVVLVPLWPCLQVEVQMRVRVQGQERGQELGQVRPPVLGLGQSTRHT